MRTSLVELLLLLSKPGTGQRNSVGFRKAVRLGSVSGSGELGDGVDGGSLAEVASWGTLKAVEVSSSLQLPM